MSFSTPPDPWSLVWTSPFQTPAYEPVYLANGMFGGMLDLSGSTMDLWSTEIAAVPETGAIHAGVAYPVTAMRTQVYYRNAHYREAGFWVGASGIHSDDPRHKADRSMPNIAQVYACRQGLDLKRGITTTSGKVGMTTQAAIEQGLGSERVIPFETRIIFLKDSPLMAIDVVSSPEVDILFSPEPFVRETFRMQGEGKGIMRMGNEISCDLEMRQTIRSTEVADGCITYHIQPNGGKGYRVRVWSAEGAEATVFLDRPGWIVREHGTFFVEVTLDGDSFDGRSFSTFSEVEGEQTRRWASFWNQSDVVLPDSAELWQQRYHTGLFYVAQSMGHGAIHATGLSKPMLPYWFGCFHDTDTYFCRALLETGHGVEAERHLAFRHRGLEIAKKIAKARGRNGAMFPWQTDAHGNGEPLELPINSAIIACEAWHQHLHSGSSSTRDMAGEIVAEVLVNLGDHLDLDATPLRFRGEPLMTFSETIVSRDPTEARIAYRAVAAACRDAVRRGANLAPQVIALAERILAELELPMMPDGRFAFASGEPEPEYQRCPSVILGSFPLHLLKNTESLQRTFDVEISRILLLFAWLPQQASIVASQLRRSNGPTGAFQLLEQAEVFYKPWHAYDEWENRRSVRAANCVTVAGAFCMAIHAMLVAETEADVWTLFPAVPEHWRDASFRDISTRAGWTISARLCDGFVVSLSARPTHRHAGPIHLEILNPHPDLFVNRAGSGHESGSTRAPIFPDQPLDLAVSERKPVVL